MKTNAETLTQKKKRKKLSPLARREELQGYLFILPWLVGLFGITLFPMLFSLYGSFTNYDVTSRMDFIGLRNYTRMFASDPLFWKSLYNTLYYVALMVPLTTIGSVLLALMLNERIAGMRVFRTIYYLPAVLSGVGVYFLWIQLLNPSSGLINTLLGWVGIPGPAWLSDPMWTKPAIIMMKLWGVGGGMLLYLASLQGVPSQLYESAKLDGASAFRRFWHITLPMISPVIFFDVVTSFIGGFQIFQEGYVMTDSGNGGPMGSLLFYNLYMWNQAFQLFDMGYAMAMAWVLFVIVLLLTLINLRMSRRWVYYEGGED
ncbi:carbohydrate ABC transporter permease [Saccharibacillus alkalitolerans]|uniref:Sugar ABC transporter permease n=1 Tax=Saccharibacillus alkalitolerans TaxID=2705290 RepID=A0ABX0F663_9BACL|nr:sugar ABC transporter permease [Saccharibacillus alkalitolerans]NGZ75420.1 sugar ABC transporter permease [Saccharibacillus alkalitolerans]